MELVIMRHGRTRANEEHRYQGALDGPLSELGRQDARDAGIHPEVERAHVSPRLRAQQTARICFPRAEQIIEEGLAEMNFGAFEGRRPDDLYGRDRAYTEWVDGGCLSACPNGESRDVFTARVADALARILLQGARRSERRVVVVAHGGTVMAALYSLAVPMRDGGRRGYFDWQVDNCEGYRCEVAFEGKTPRLSRCTRFSDLGFLTD